MALLGWAVQRGWLTPVDEAGLRAFRDPDAAPVWRAVSWLGGSGVRLAIAAFVAACLIYPSVLSLSKQRPPSGLEKGSPSTASGRTGVGQAGVFLVLVLGGLAVNGVAKTVASRPRPGLLPHLEQVEGYSFPSGHAAGMTVLALGLALLLPERHRLAGLLLATGVLLLVGLSRIALAVHWPSDVLAGWMEGLGWVLLVRSATESRRG